MDTTGRFVHQATRPHHYLFAHRTLRALFEERPSEIMEVLKQGQHKAFLEDLWFRCAEPFGGAIFEDELHFEVRIYTRESEDIAVIVIPPPIAVGEAYMLGLVVRPALDPPGVLTWYYTLELGMQADYQTPCTTLACWEGSDRLYHGAVSVPSPQRFLEEILHRTSC